MIKMKEYKVEYTTDVNEIEEILNTYSKDGWVLKQVILEPNNEYVVPNYVIIFEKDAK